MRRLAWVAVEALALLLAAAPLPIHVVVAAGHLALWLPAWLLVDAALANPEHRKYAWLLAFPVSLALALLIGLSGQFWLGLERLPIAALLLVATTIGAALRRDRAAPIAPADRVAIAVLGLAAVAVPAIYSAFDPNRGNLTAYDSWFTFLATQEIARFGGILQLGYYPRGVHYFFAIPHVLGQRFQVGDFVAAVYHYRVVSFLGISAVAWAVAREFRLPNPVAVACGLSVYLFNPGGTPSPWHVMPRAASMVLVPALLLLALWLSRAHSWRVAGLAGVLLVASVYLHELTAVVLLLLTASYVVMRGTRSWLAPVLVAVFSLVLFFPPEFFPYSDRIPIVGALFRAKYYPVDPISSHTFSFYPLTFTLAAVGVAAVLLFSANRGERGLALFAALLPIGTSSEYVPERWFLYLQPFAFTIAFLAIGVLAPARRPRVRRWLAPVVLLALASVAVTHTAYWSWAQADVSPAERDLYDATWGVTCTPFTDFHTYLQLRAAHPSARDAPEILRSDDPRSEFGEDDACIAITGRTSKWFALPDDPTLVLPQPFAAHPALVKFGNQTNFERLFASTYDDDAFLLRYRGTNASYVQPTVHVLSHPTAESDNNTKSRWVTETALFRLGVAFETRPAENLSAAQLATIDTLVIPTDDLAWRFPGQQAISIMEFVRDGGHVVALAGPYGDLNGLFGVQSLSEVQVHTRAIHWDTPAGRATTELKYEIDSHRYTLTPEAEVLARDGEGRPVVWRVHYGQGTVVVSPLQRLPAGNDVYHLLKAMWLFAQDDDEKAIAAATVPPPPGYSPIHEPSYRFYTWWRDLQAPHYAWAKPLIIVGSLAAVVAASVRETVLWIRARRAGEPHTR